MKLSNNYFFTIREDVKNEESKSGNLLVRSGMIKKTSAGIYMYLPMGFRVLENVKKVIREEMNKSGALELGMPLLINEDYFIKSGRINSFGEEMFSLNDRTLKKYALGPTHEELFTVSASYNVKSYKDLPFNLYQIGKKFRDERRPRFGLIRVREFTMKDAYSFDRDGEGLDKSYNIMLETYKRIFDRLNLNYVIVKSDTGAMGGLLSEEFQVLTDIGEDTLVTCSCGYASNLEIAKSYFEEESSKEEKLEKELIRTPNIKTIDEVKEFLNIDVNKLVKSLIYKTNDGLVMILLKGNDELNTDKLSKVLNSEVTLATVEEVNRVSSIGFAGPIDINMKVIADVKVKNMVNFVVGANKKDHHYKNVNLSDFEVNNFSDISNVKPGDLCPVCKKELEFSKGIEAGNIFKLGTKYSEAFNLNYIDKDNKLKPVVMGCYGIGIARILASYIEQHHDDFGIIFSPELAPYEISIVIVNMKDEKQVELAEKIYQTLLSHGKSVLLDDRNLRVGVKFKDMDLIGIPKRITVGKRAEEGIVEYKERISSDVLEIEDTKVLDYV